MSNRMHASAVASFCQEISQSIAVVLPFLEMVSNGHPSTEGDIEHLIKASAILGGISKAFNEVDEATRIEGMS